MNSQNQTSKFHTGHFPAGTIVVLNDEMYHYTTSKTPGEEFEITKIVRTGPSNYVLETTKKMDREAFGDMNQSFNMTHVKAIVKRGDGPMVFHERNFDPTDFMFLEEKHIIENHLNIKTKKTHFVHWSLRDIVMFCIRDRNINGGGIFDIEKCLEAVNKQSFVNFFDTRAYGIGGFSVDKKRLKRFMQQNYNRFLISVKKAQKQQDEIDNKFYADDYFGSSFGLDEDPIAAEGLDQDKLFPNRQEGSSYDDGSDYSPFDSDGSSLGEEHVGLSTDDERLLTGQPTLDKMLEGGIPARQLAVFSSDEFTEDKYKYGIELNTVVMSDPPVTEDGIMISDNALVKDLAKKHEEDM